MGRGDSGIFPKIWLGVCGARTQWDFSKNLAWGIVGAGIQWDISQNLAEYTWGPDSGIFPDTWLGVHGAGYLLIIA